MNAILRILIGVEFAALLSLGFAIGVYFLDPELHFAVSLQPRSCVEHNASGGDSDRRTLAAGAVEVGDPLRLPAERLVVEEADVHRRRRAHGHGRLRHERPRPQQEHRGGGEHDGEEGEPLQVRRGRSRRPY